MATAVADWVRALKNDYYLIRHGISEANLQKLIVSDPKVGCIKYGLAAEGRPTVLQTAEDIAASLTNTNEHPLLIYCSDFSRTRDTAQLLYDRLVKLDIRVSEPPIAVPNLRERYFGPEFDLTHADNYEKIWQYDPQTDDNDAHGAETPRQVMHRVMQLIERVESQNEGRVVVLVSHGDTLQMLLASACGKPPGHHRVGVPHFRQAELRILSANGVKQVTPP